MKSMLAKYKWWILGALLLAGGLAFYFHKKKKDADAAAAAAAAAAGATKNEPLLAEEAESGMASQESIRRSILANDVAGALN